MNYEISQVYLKIVNESQDEEKKEKAAFYTSKIKTQSVEENYWQCREMLDPEDQVARDKLDKIKETYDNTDKSILSAVYKKLMNVQEIEDSDDEAELGDKDKDDAAELANQER